MLSSNFCTIFMRSLNPRSLSIRHLFRPNRNIPFLGIYKREDELVRKDDLLVCQLKMNYHPGLNVYMKNDRGQLLLKALSEGRVMITQEKIDPDFTIPEMLIYKEKGDEIYKLTFNVIPFEMSQTFRLVNEI